MLYLPSVRSFQNVSQSEIRPFFFCEKNETIKVMRRKSSSLFVIVAIFFTLTLYNNCAKKMDVSTYLSDQSSLSAPCGQGGYREGSVCVFNQPTVYHAPQRYSFRIWGSDSYVEAKGYANVGATNAGRFCIQQFGVNSQAVFYTSDISEPGDAGEDESFYLIFSPTTGNWVLEGSGSAEKNYALLTEVKCSL